MRKPPAAAVFATVVFRSSSQSIEARVRGQSGQHATARFFPCRDIARITHTHGRTFRRWTGALPGSLYSASQALQYVVPFPFHVSAQFRTSQSEAFELLLASLEEV